MRKLPVRLRALLALAALVAPPLGLGVVGAVVAATVSPARAAPEGARVELDPSSMEIFRARGVDGAFVLLDLRTDAVFVANAAQAETGYIPASTFKIPNTLIGLETGVIPGESFTLKWDGKPRQIAAWNRTHDLASAMKHSVVWYYQEVARRIGEDRMKRHVDAFGYGNRDISGGIDRFWLDGKLRVTPKEQVAFLKKLFTGKLPVRAENVALLRRLIVLEDGHGHTLRGKTGLGAQDGRIVGWLVGAYEAGDASYVYATLVLGSGGATDAEMARIVPLRLEITKALLRRRGLAVD